jgi:hypothetical protein
MRPSPLARLLTLLAVSAGLVSCGGGGGTDPSPHHTPPTHTPVGVPIGGPVTQTVGAGGGTVTSSDGVLALVIPAGALTGSSDITIQRITAQAPGATGDGYRLTPEGLIFAQPVTLRLAYGDANLESSAPEFLWVASQEADGSWLLAPGVVLDIGARTLTVTTAHFSDWTMLQGLQIRPPAATLKPTESQNLMVKKCTTIVETSSTSQSSYAIDCEDAPTQAAAPGDDELPPLPTFSVDQNSWAVNGTRGGSATHGFVAGDGSAGQYVAPTTTPSSGNPVAVSVRVRDSRDQTVSTLVANIEILPVCGPGGGAPRPSAEVDVCSADWSGTSQSTITDATPFYHIDAQVSWKFDAAQSGGGQSFYYAEGTVTFTPVDPCISITPSSYTWVKDNPTAGGDLHIDYSVAQPAYSGFGTALWPATYSNLCDGSQGPYEAAAGGAWFVGEGTLPSVESATIAGTFSSSGQTFQYGFTRLGASAARATGVRRRP